jgi:outer membrane murein-binding lipoprotein Lpp
VSLNSNNSTLPTFPSMIACAGATGIPLAALRQAKRAGCPAFDQANRVHLAPLLRWLFSVGATEMKNTDWHARLKRSQALRSELETAKRRGELVDAQVLGTALMNGGHAMRAALMNAITIDATKLAAAGDDIPRNREALREVLWGAFEQVGKAMAPYLAAVDAHTRAEAAKISNPPNDEETDETKAPSDDGREGAPTARRKRQSRSTPRARARKPQADEPGLGGGVRTTT